MLDAVPDTTYTHGHDDGVLRSHRWRTAANSAAYLLPHLAPGTRPARRGVRTGHHHLRPGPGRGTRAGWSGSTPPPTWWRRPGPRPTPPGVDGVAFEVADLFALPFADDTFDVVHAHQVLQHVADPVARPGRDAAGVPARRPGGRPRRRLPGVHLRPGRARPDPGHRRLRRAHPGQPGPLGRRPAAARAGPTPPGSPRWCPRPRCGASPPPRSGRGGAGCGPTGSPRSAMADQLLGHGIADRADLTRSPPAGGGGRPRPTGGSPCSTARSWPPPERASPGRVGPRPEDGARGSGRVPRPSGSGRRRRAGPPGRRAGPRPAGRPWPARRPGRRYPTRRSGATGGRATGGVNRVLVPPALLDVAGQPGQEALAALGGDQRPLGVELVVVRRRPPGRRWRPARPARRPGRGRPAARRSSGRASSSRWPSLRWTRSMNTVPLVSDPVGHLDVPGPLELAGQELAPDGVADVVGEQPEPVDAQVGEQGHGHVGLAGQPVGAVGLGRQAEARGSRTGPPGGGRPGRRPPGGSRTTRWGSRGARAAAAPRRRPAAGTSTMKTRSPSRCGPGRGAARPRPGRSTTGGSDQEPGAEQVEDLVERLPGRGAGTVVEVLGEDRVGALPVAVRDCRATSRARRRRTRRPAARAGRRTARAATARSPVKRRPSTQTPAATRSTTRSTSASLMPEGLAVGAVHRERERRLAQHRGDHHVVDHHGQGEPAGEAHPDRTHPGPAAPLVLGPGEGPEPRR